MVFLLAGVLIFRQSPSNGQTRSDTETSPSPLFRNWDKMGKPEVALVLTGEMHGYLQPCGCSAPQYGGLARRYNFIQSLKHKGWPVVAVDLGDIASRGGPQALLKFETSMKALELMNYSALALGKNEFYLPLIDALSYSINHPTPRILGANLRDDEVGSWLIADKGAPPVGVLGLIGPSVVDEVKKHPNVKFDKDNKAVITRNLTRLAARKPELVVLLYQGTDKEARACASFCAVLHKANPKIPRLDVVLRLEEDETPSGEPRFVGKTMIVGVGHKGRYLGVVGAFREKAGKPFTLKYQLVSIGPEFETPEGKENSNPVMALMEQYALKVKNGNYLSKYPRTKHPVQLSFPDAKFVGSRRCKSCHPQAYKVWEGSKHALAFKTLEKARHPSLRQFDGECVSCHVVGFQYTTGYADSGNAAEFNSRLLNVGCESCHGPGSAHVANSEDRQLQALMNPYKARPGESPAARNKRLNDLDTFCQKCHDIDNDVHWGKVPFLKKWEQIAHPTPAKAAKAE